MDDDGSPSADRGGPFAPAPPTGGPSAAPVLGATTTPWVLDLIRRFRAAGPSARVCAHLAEDPVELATWSASIPDLRSCRRAVCAEAVAAALEQRLGHPLRDEPTRCTTCGQVGVAVRGVGVAVGPTMLRGTVCEDCLAARPVPTPSSATAPVTPAADLGGPATIDDEPIAVDPTELAEAEDVVPFDAVGRRVLRRGWLMADACCRSTAAGLDADQAVVGGLLVRAAKLAHGLADSTPARDTGLHDLAFRSLVETTTALDVLLRRHGRDAGGAIPRGAGRGGDRAIPFRAEPDAVPASWRELAGRHLTDGPTGTALDRTDDGIGPLEALLAGERLAVACADYVERMPTDLHPEHVRPLAEEVTALRATVEVAYAEAVATGRVA